MKYVARPFSPGMRTARRPQGAWDDDVSETARTAHVDDRPEFEDTGLLDADGNRLYRQRDPIGFRPR